MADPVPVLFIHYGPSGYLRHTFAAALRSNPGKRIVFLGDESNRRLCPRGVDFQPFAEFESDPLLAEFREVFRPICGAAHRFNKQEGVEKWLRFVFERWFYIRAFLEAEGVRRFWTFDSDTLVAADLSSREERFSGYGATEQCRGCCLNGLINDPRIVDGYVRAMIALYRDEGFLDAQRERLRQHPGLAFNEMDAWRHYRAKEGIVTVPLGVPRDGEVFDDALGIAEGFVLAAGKVRGRIPIRAVLVDRRGAAFALQAPGGEPVRLVTLNLSWLPEYLFKRLLVACGPLGKLDFVESQCRPLDLSEPLALRLARIAASARARLVSFVVKAVSNRGLVWKRLRE